MLNTEHFVTLGGIPDKWDSEMRERTGECSLTELQESQSARGYRPAILVATVRGWSVRFASGLQGFSIIIRGRGESRAEVVKLGIDWANQDPYNREFYARKKDMESFDRWA